MGYEYYRTFLLLGDIVGSRRKYADRTAFDLLHRNWVQAVGETSQMLKPRAKLIALLGDGAIGTFDTLGKAIEATAVLRMKMLTSSSPYDVRFGIGYGIIAQSEETNSPYGLYHVTGPCYYAAERAINHVRMLMARDLSRGYPRTYFGAFDSRKDGNRPTQISPGEVTIDYGTIAQGPTPQEVRGLNRDLRKRDQEISRMSRDGMVESLSNLEDFHHRLSHAEAPALL